MGKSLDWLNNEVSKKQAELEKNFRTTNSEARRMTLWGFNLAKEFIDQVEQPKKPEIPEYVAVYIMHEQEAGLSLKESLNHLKNRDFQEICFVGSTASYLDESYENFDKYVDAYRNGYVIEKEKIEVEIELDSIIETLKRELGLEYVKLVERTQGERFGNRGYTKEITVKTDGNETIKILATPAEEGSS